MSASDIFSQKCKPCEGGVAPLSKERVDELMTHLSGWQVNDDCTMICCDIKFKDFYQTMAFVNAVAYIANQQGHHPDLQVGYSHCKIEFMTHAIGGLSENDFICAAHVDQLL
jgi:4a-hydroxytetrahydrobiopterin dehydratase